MPEKGGILMNIEGERVKLRSVTLADLEKLIVWSQDPEVSAYLESDYPQDLDEVPEWFQKIKTNRQNKRWAIDTKDGVLIGDVELDHITWRNKEAELRICIGDKRYWNKGYGSEVISIISAYAFDKMKLQRIYLRVFADNTRAVKCYLKSGFSKKGRLQRPDHSGNMRDILLMLKQNVPVMITEIQPKTNIKFVV
jgi:RimJ/RimL family protein N-acetyltransferase